MKLDVDVAIIGGGLVGSSAALALRGKGLTVTVLDKGFCGAQASGINYGGVRRQGRPPEQLPLAQRAHAIWPHVAALIGLDGEYRRTGHLKLARTQAEMASLEAYARTAAHFGLNLELLDRKALQQRYGWISDDAVGGSLSPDDGQANPRLVATGFAAAARRAGASVLENTPVLDVAHGGSSFAIEAAHDVRLRARHVVNSAGAWSAPFAAAFGEVVPLSSIYPAMIVTEPVEPVMTVNIGIEGGGIYARQVERGNCVVGGERGTALSDPDFSRPTADGAVAIMRRAAAFFPALRHAHAIRFWSGTEGAMPDRNPVIGPSMTTPGLIHAFGFSGAGFQIAPAVGEVLAELICSGSTSTPIAAFSVSRFTDRAAEGTRVMAEREH